MWLCHQVTFESLLANSSLGQAHALFGITCRSSSRENPKPPVVVVQFLSCVRLFVTPWTAAHQAPLAFTISQSLLKLMSSESVMSSNHVILCHPLHLLLSIFCSIRVFPNESALHIRWPKYWSFNFSISPSNEYSRLISFRIEWIDLVVQGTSRVSSSTTIRKHQFFGTRPSLWSNSHNCT